VGGFIQPIFFARAAKRTTTTATHPTRLLLPATPEPSASAAPAVRSWQAAIERTVTGFGFDLVDAERSAGGLLRVTIDRLPGQVYDTPGELVTVEDCERLTRQLQYVLEVEGLDYARLEVSSPGLDRPLKKLSDWQRFTGCEVQVTLRVAFQGRKHWKGVLAERDGGWRLELPPPVPAARKPGAKVGKATLAKAQAAAQEQQQALDFTLDEVREARLVPVVNFKGRAVPPQAGPQAAADDGGSIR
jgi:ribosome maturation factor RimP